MGLVPPTLNLADVAPYLRLTKLGFLQNKKTLLFLVPVGCDRPKVTWFTVLLLLGPKPLQMHHPERLRMAPVFNPPGNDV